VGLQYNFLKYRFTIPKYGGSLLSSGHTGSPCERVRKYNGLHGFLAGR
jgi:hypothetical protein